MDFEEKPAWKMHVGTYVQGQEGSVEATAGLRNPLGSAEHVQLTLDYGSQKSSEYALQLWKPRLFGCPWKVCPFTSGEGCPANGVLCLTC